MARPPGQPLGDEPSLLPTPARRTFVVRALETLRRARGDRAFVDGPIFEPGDRWFPDRWEPTTEGVRVLANRILRHAGLAPLEATVHGYRHDREGAFDQSGRARESWHEGAAAWYAGTDEAEGYCRFGVDLDGLAEAASIVGTMCHEVAHAYRDAHALVIEDRDREEELTDLTTVFLGFGVLTTNSAYVYRSQGLAGSSFGGHRWTHERRGYLSVAELAYALAYQVGVRRRGEQRHIAALLEPTQRACFEAALEELGVVEPRRVWPAWASIALVLAAPAIGLALIVAYLLATRSTECRADHDCGSTRHDRCMSGICVRLCRDDADCEDGQRCSEVNRRSICVGHAATP